MLYFVPTPIGNLSDISAHALDILSRAEVAICEDTRVSKQLLNLLCIDEIDLYNIKEKTAFIIIADKILDLVNIFLDQLINIKVPFTYILDNFDSLKAILGLENLLNNASYYKNKVFASAHNEDMIIEKYGKFILDKFDCVINLNKDNRIINNYNKKDLGNDCEYPILNMIKPEYLNFINILI